MAGMSEQRVGTPKSGPLAYAVVSSAADVIVFDEHPGMAYHWTRPTDTNWRETIDHDWWMHGTPEPVPPHKTWEWHERDWVSPEVAAIRGAIHEAADRLR